MKRLIIAAVGLGLVMAAIMLSSSNSTSYADDSETATAAAYKTPTPTQTPTSTPMPVGSGCYTNWNDATCAPGFTVVSSGYWTAVSVNSAYSQTTGAQVLCAAKADNDLADDVYAYADTNGWASGSHKVQGDACAVCCGVTGAGSPSVVGGIAESPDLATRTGASGVGGGTYAVLVGGLGLAGLGIFAVKRRGIH